MNKKLLGIAAAVVGTPLVWASDVVQEVVAKLTNTTLPYLEQFDSQSAFDEWTVIDANGDGYTFNWSNSSGLNYVHGSARFAMNQSDGLCAEYGDDWLISPAFELKADRNYHFSYFSRATVGMTTDMRIYVGRGNTVEDMTQEVFAVSTDNYNAIWDFEFCVPEDGTYHIGFHETSYGGKTKFTYSYSNYISEIVLEEASSRLIPAQISNLTQVPGANGALSMGLTWTNPSQTLGGEDLDALQEVRIYKDGSANPIVLTDNLTPGSPASWTDPNPTAGAHTYRLTAVNSAGESYSSSVNTFVGVDTPGAPQNLTATVDGTVVTLNWEAASFGANGGWYDDSTVRYRVVREPGSTVLSASLTGTTFTDNTISSLNAYRYIVTSTNADGTGLTASTDYLQIGRVASFPLRQDFEDDVVNSLWLISDTNGDGEGWRVTRGDRGHDAPKALVSDLWNAGIAMSQDVIYSPAVKIEKGETYRVTFWGNTNLYNTETLHVYYGKDRSLNAMNTLAAAFEEIGTGGAYEEFSATFVAEQNFNVGYFAFYVEEFGSRFFLDDIKIEHVTANDIEIAGVTNLSTAVTVGKEVTTSVSYRNAGNAQCRGFRIELVDLDGNVLASRNVARAINAGVTNNTTLTWTPTQVGRMPYYVRAVFGESNPDTQPDNNVSAVQYMNILPYNEVVQTIGTEQNLNAYFPFNYEGQIFNETVYPASYMEGVTGIIDSIAYKVHFGHSRDYYDVDCQIWMGETDRADMSAGWIPSTELQLVYDGGIDLTYGIKDLTIPLQYPYDYQGGNLVVMLLCDHDMHMLSDGYGMRSYVSQVGSGSVTRYWYKEWYVDIDPANPDQNEGRFSDYAANMMFYVNVEGKGAVSGTVKTGSTALENARVSVDGTKAYTYTDARGAYSLPYVSAGQQTITASKSGYESVTATVNVEEGGTLTQDFQLAVKPQVGLSGHIVGSNDLTQPIVGASVKLSQYGNYAATTDANGDFAISSIYGNASYLLTINAVGYQEYADTIEVGASDTSLGTIVLKQEAAQPAVVTAVETGNAAQISWTEPLSSHWLRKDQTDAVGSFGGSYEYAVAHRYLPSEMAAEGLVDGLYVTKVRFYAASAADFVLKIWQGQTDAEAEVYSQEVNITRFDQWTEIILDQPYKIDLTRNLLVGFHISQQIGARPVAFDYGPLQAGGDVMFDDDTNAWTSAHALVSSMAYNFLIRTYCSVDPNNGSLDLAPDYGEAQSAERHGIALRNPSSDLDNHMIVPGAKAEYSMEILADDTRLEAARAAGRLKADEPDSTKPLGYSVWRLENGSENDESQWTLVTTQPVTGFSCIDNGYGAITDKLYRYAVRSVFANDVLSEPTFSNGLDKGRYAAVTGHVVAQTGNAVGAVASLENSTGYYEAVVDAGGNLKFDNVYFGKYAYTIRKSYYQTVVDTVVISDRGVTLDEQQLLVDARAPKLFTATDYVNTVELSWAAPSKSQGVWAHKDGVPGEYGIGFTNGGELTVGQRFTPAELEQFSHSDFYISYIAIRTFAPQTYTIKVWNGNEGNEFEIYSQDVNIDTEGEWTAVKLDQPLKLDPYLSYVFGYYCKHEAGYFPMGIDQGPRVEGGDAMYLNGAWTNFYLGSASQYSVNWSIRTFITDDANEVIDPADLEDDLVTNARRKAPSADNEAMPLTYKLWRTTEAGKADAELWTPITPEAITETSYSDASWAQASNGAYYYVIKAIYNGEAESEPVFSKLLDKGNTSLVNLLVKTDNGKSAEGAYVTLSNDANKYAATVKGDTTVFAGVYLGTYDLSITFEGYEAFSQEVTFSEPVSNLTVTLQEIPYPPVGVKAVLNADGNAVVSWKAPRTYVPSPGWFYWDDGEAYAAFSMNGSFFGVGHVYNILDQTELGMKGLTITQVSFPVLDYYSIDSTRYVPTEGTYVIKIWKGETLEEVYSQTMPSFVKNAWNTVLLDEPFYVEGDDYLMFGYEFTGSGYPAAIDRGPAVVNKGDIGATAQGSWVPLNQAGYNYNFVFHVYGEDLSGNEEEAPERAPRIFDGSESSYTPSELQFSGSLGQLTLGAQKVIATPARQKAQTRVASELTYKVYRHGAREFIENRWKLLTSEPIAECRYVDEDFSNLAAGSYIYSVKAVYASGDSEAASSNPLSPSGLDAVSACQTNVSATTRQLVITAPEAGRAMLYDAAGILVFNEPVVQGVNEFDVSLTSGAYVLTVNGETLPISVK